MTTDIYIIPLLNKFQQETTKLYSKFSTSNCLFQVLAEVTLRPQLSEEEMESARQAVAFELETLSMRPEQETILMDMIHSVSTY